MTPLVRQLSLSEPTTGARRLRWQCSAVSRASPDGAKTPSHNKHKKKVMLLLVSAAAAVRTRLNFGKETDDGVRCAE